jgi:hypothetical protein
MSEEREPRPIRWTRWEPQLVVTHMDPSCDACAFPGPLRNRFGLTRKEGYWTRQITRHSKIAEGQRPQSQPYWIDTHWVRTHYAVRCPGCGERRVYRLATMAPWGEMQELEQYYIPPTLEGMLPLPEVDM